MEDWRTAPIREPLRAMLGYLEKLTLAPESIGPADVDALYEAGLDDAEIADAVHVCALFSIYTRLADAMGWAVPTDPAVWSKQAKFLLRHGYVPGKKPHTAANPA